MEKLITKYINAKDIHIKDIKAKIQQINVEIEKCETQISITIEKINSANPSGSCSVSELLMMDSYLNSLRREKEQLLKNLEELTKEMQNYESILKTHSVEKKAAERFLEKLKKKQQREELKEEVKISDETFSFKYIRNRSNGRFGL